MEWYNYLIKAIGDIIEVFIETTGLVLIATIIAEAWKRKRGIK